MRNVQAELVPHLVAPLQRQAGRADDQHRPGPVPQHQLLHDQAGLDRLAQPDVVGDQQVGPRHGQRPDHRVELIVLDLDTGAERRLQHGLVRRGDRAPAHRVQEGVQLGRVVEAVDPGWAGRARHGRPRRVPVPRRPGAVRRGRRPRCSPGTPRAAPGRSALRHSRRPPNPGSHRTRPTSGSARSPAAPGRAQRRSRRWPSSRLRSRIVTTT